MQVQEELGQAPRNPPSQTAAPASVLPPAKERRCLVPSVGEARGKSIPF